MDRPNAERNAVEMARLALDPGTPEEEALGHLASLVESPAGDDALRRVLEERGCATGADLDALSRRVRDRLFPPDDPAAVLRAAWTRLEAALARAFALPVARPLPSAAYLDGVAVASPGLEVCRVEPDGSLRVLQAIERGATGPAKVGAEPGASLVFRFRPGVAGRAFAFAARRGETPARLVYPLVPSDPTCAGPDAPIRLAWDVDPDPVRVVFLCVDWPAGEDPASLLRQREPGAWEPDGEADLVDLLGSGVTVLEGLEVHLA